MPEYIDHKSPKKEIHFYEDLYDLLEGKQIGTICLSWLDVCIAIRVGDKNIVTTQMSFMSTKLIERGYRLFVHPAKRGTYELTLGACVGTDKEVRPENNLFQMWKNGAFSFSPPSAKGDIV